MTKGRELTNALLVGIVAASHGYAAALPRFFANRAASRSAACSGVHPQSSASAAARSLLIVNGEAGSGATGSAIISGFVFLSAILIPYL